MSKFDLRGASRRDFIKGAFAIGAALGWGPTRIWDFITRAGGDALADCTTKGVQNVVFLVGGQGAHGYSTLLFPTPDMFTTGRTVNKNGTWMTPDGNDLSAFAFVKGVATGGSSVATASTPLRNGLMNQINYAAPPAEDDSSGNNWRGKWSAGQRFKRVTGVDNQAFGNFQSPDATSKANDLAEWGVNKVPSNLSLTADKKFLIAARETPWINKYGLKKAITSIDGGGINVFHVNGSHNHFINFDKKQSVFAAAATIQLVRPSIVPVIMVGAMDASSIENLGTTNEFYGASTKGNTIPGAPAPALVSQPSGMVDLFASNAAKAAGLLSKPAGAPAGYTAKNAILYEAYVKGMIGNSKTATLPTFNRGYRSAKLGANLVGLNLADQLQVSDADRARYGYTSTASNKYTLFRDNLIITAKAMKLGLTSQVVFNYFLDDPHSLFDGGDGGQSGTGDNAQTAATSMSNFLNAFMDDLMAVPDPFCPGIKLGDNTVICFVGDTQRTQVTHLGWNDPTRGSQNRAFIMSNGLLKTGFFGADRNRFMGDNAGNNNDHNSAGPGEGGLWDLRTGDMLTFNAAQDTRRFQYGDTAMAAVLYAITRGDIRRVNDFYSGPEFPAAQVPVLL